MLRRVVGATCVVAGGAGATTYYSFQKAAARSAATTTFKPVKGSLTAADWNAVQDKAAIEAAFATPEALRSAGVVLYELAGCPFCARVRAVLDYTRTPYTTTTVNPLSFTELLPVPYQAVPQIQLAGKAGDAKPAEATVAQYPIVATGPFVADSEEILKRLAKTNGFDIAAEKVAKRRQWISTDVQRLVFGVANGRYTRAMQTVPASAPPEFRNIFFRIFGAIPLYLLARFKVAKRVEASLSDEERAKWAPGGKLDFDAVLEAQLAETAKDMAPFHGGAKPDIVDVELYGVLRSLDPHPAVAAAVGRSGLGDWRKQMDAHTPSARRSE